MAEPKRGKVGSAFLSVIFTLALLDFLGRIFPKRKNVKGSEVPTGCGLAPLLAWVALEKSRLPALVLMAAVGGLLDDLRPREAGGIARRLKKLVEGEVDLALVKATIVTLSAAISARTNWKGRGLWVLDTLLMASFAHTVNLLDTTPGRAVKWLLMWGLIATKLGKSRAGGLSALLWPLLAYAPGDLRGRYMMGDSGAYGLGMAFSQGLCEAPLGAKLAMVALFLALSLYAESGSISRAIQRRPILKTFDRLGTGRGG